ncbi:MAG: RagB/SusD family nutrient uptake outer membrane protein [Lacibacter sp.]
MKHNKIFISFAFILVIASGCKKLLQPEIENYRNLEESYLPSDARYPYGILLNAYNRIPTNSWSFNDVATDDAVTNDKASSFLKMATGQWTANNNPMNQWDNCFSAIQYLNITLLEIKKITWAGDDVVNKLFAMRITGETYGLRALFMYHLLQTHGGVSAKSGELLGVPILLEPQSTTSNFNLPRAKFEDCMKQLYKDLDSAVALLPLDYGNVASASLIPSKYGSIAPETYNRAFGVTFRGLFTARIADAIRAKAALLAASPAFSAGNSTTWADAANYAAAVINSKGGVSGLTAGGTTLFTNSGITWFYNKAEIDALADGSNPAEILWRTNYSSNGDLEAANYPPTLYGNGRINPTQNLVDAFPMANGYPITNSSSGYDATKPYTGRDPRLLAFILINGGTAGPGNTAINTAADGTTNDALNKVETSTRTGYYMRKLLRQDVNRNPTSINNQKHYKPHIRYTEIYLDYAEAANEAWGPTGTGSNTYSAYDVIKAIRARAGVGTTNGDAYLEAAKADKASMRELIRNERRLELCFEGYRFWDLRRWNADITEVAKGMSIAAGTYSVIQVENRTYQSHMNYGPLPYNEVLKFNALDQNKGW